MSKKGISPLIATILIVGFTIVLAAVFYKWVYVLFVGNEVRQDTCESKALTVCEKIVSMQIINMQPSDQGYIISAKNTGQYRISGIKFIVNNKEYIIDSPEFNPGVSADFTVQPSETSITSLTAIPRVYFEETSINCQLFCDKKKFKYV